MKRKQVLEKALLLVACVICASSILPTKALVLHALINIQPDKIVVTSNIEWVYASIQLPEGYSPADIDVSTILFQSLFLAEWHNIQEDTLVVGFDGSTVIDYLSDWLSNMGVPEGIMELTVTGFLYNGLQFAGSDAVFVSTRVSEFESYAKLAEARAKAYAAYSGVLFYYSYQNEDHYNREILVNALANLIPVLADLAETALYEIEGNVIAQIKAETKVIVDFKEWLDGLEIQIEQVVNWIGVAPAVAGYTYSRLIDLKTLCEEEAIAWRSEELADVEALLEQEEEKIGKSHSLEALDWATDFQYYAKTLKDPMAQEVADATVAFLGKDLDVISKLTGFAEKASKHT